MNFNDIPQSINETSLVGFVDKKLPKISYDYFIKKINEDDLSLSIDNVLSENEILELSLFFENNNKITTKKDTIKLSYGVEDDGIMRSCFYDIYFAIMLSKRINPFLNKIEVVDGHKYQLIGLNPLIRFIFYNKNNHKLIPHYDIPVTINKEKNITTLKTLVLYLNDANSGYTRFLKDTRKESLTDSFQSFPIIKEQKPQKGLGIIFNHGIFHESAEIKNNDNKLIITTEICYQLI